MKIVGQEIDKYYGHRQVLYRADFEILLNQPGIIGLIGPNGAGKSTLMRLLSGITTPNSGKLFLEDSATSKVDDYSSWSRDNAYYVPTGERGLRNKLSIKDNLRYFAALRQVSPTRALESLQRIAKDFQIEDLLDRDIDQMSTGQKKKAEIMVAVALDARLLLLDEPSNGFDIDAQVKLMHLIRTVGNTETKKIIISSHDPHLLANVANQYILIAEGHILKTLDQSLSEAELQEVYEQLFNRGN
ncbi:ATP-binding cassette domain-containing protein [Lapidilactobacillus bayanensis]|uniref:ATP-binding cassette domain-containing protein n=1 Tax=Lapidilactobacillus bayanensis TaxID=2485998 RepID=UPI000F774FB7|nr:ATP-binding cassette domain-containing protein [Lapidilactobacillus bayanensis]